MSIVVWAVGILVISVDVDDVSDVEVVKLDSVEDSVESVDDDVVEMRVVLDSWFVLVRVVDADFSDVDDDGSGSSSPSILTKNDLTQGWPSFRGPQTGHDHPFRSSQLSSANKLIQYRPVDLGSQL